MTKSTRPSARLRRFTPLFLALAVLIATPLAVVAADGFTDVSDSNVFKSDIEWMADAGVTKGCNPPDNTEFCPSDNVTREQMAAFMHRLAANKVVDAATAEDADAVGGYGAADLMSIAFGDTCKSACENTGDQMAMADVTLPGPGIVALNYSLSVENNSGGEMYAITWASKGECETAIVVIIPVPGNALPGSLAYHHIQNGNVANLSGTTTVSATAGDQTYSSCLIALGDHDVQHGTLTGTWNPGSAGVELASSDDVVTFTDDEIADMEAKLSGSAG